MMLQEQTSSPKFRRLAFFQRHSWLYGAWAQLMYFAALFALGLVITLLVYFLDVPDIDSCLTTPLFVVTIVEGVLAVVFMVIAIVFLWKIEDAYVVKQELILILVVGFPTLVLWAVASTVGWSGGYGPQLFTGLLEIFAICVMIWMPLIRTFYFERQLGRRRLESIDEKSMTSSDTTDDEFRYVMMEETTLLPKFEE